MRAIRAPQHNPTPLQQIIAGLTDGVILVGGDQRILWANEAALEVHGVKRLKDLGATVSQYRKRFRLRYRNNRRVERGNYPIDRVIAGETFSDVTVVVTPAGKTEKRWFHTIRSLVIKDSAGEPDCLALIVRDETERFEAEDRFESAFNANPAPAVICRISDLCYVRANPGFLEMTGYTRKHVIGAPLQKIDILAHAEKRDLALERLKEGRTIPQMESRVPLRDGSPKFVIVAGEPIEIGEEKCILFTFADLDPLKKTEVALRQSEQRFAKSFRLSPVPAAICRLDGLKFVEVNEAFKTMTGYSDEEVMGRNASDLRLWSEKADQQQFERALKAAGSVRNADLQLRAKDDTLFECLVSADTVTINDEQCVLFVMQDVTERKRSRDELIAAIETVMADTSWFSRTVVEKLAALRQSSRPRVMGGSLKDLTEREREILDLICQGQSDKEMSSTLKLSPNTVRNHVSSLYRKIGVNRRAAAIIWARERGVTGKNPTKRHR
jgi:PAS domain S-box-containing protein